MEQLFGCCIHILHLAFKTGVSEEQYHQIVECLCYMAKLPPCDQEIKKKILSKYGWPETYDPCGFDPCRVRFCLSFTQTGDNELQSHLEDFVLARQEYTLHGLEISI